MASVPAPGAPTWANGPRARILIEFGETSANEFGETSASTFNVLSGTAGTDISNVMSEEEEWAQLEAEAFSGAELDRIAEYLRESGQAST